MKKIEPIDTSKEWNKISGDFNVGGKLEKFEVSVIACLDLIEDKLNELIEHSNKCKCSS